MQSHIKISGKNTFINILNERKYNKVTPGFPGGTVVRNPPANSEDARDASLIHGLGRSPAEGNATHSGIPAWKMLLTEEPGGLQSIGLQSIRHD